MRINEMNLAIFGKQTLMGPCSPFLFVRWHLTMVKLLEHTIFILLNAHVLISHASYPTCDFLGHTSDCSVKPGAAKMPETPTVPWVFF